MVTFASREITLLIILAQKILQERPDTFDVKVFDGAAVAYFLSTTNITTFNEYAGGVTSLKTWRLPKELTLSGILTSPAS